ncbi:MAG: hypothetical protein JST76_04190 [Bacteroidetes bacterium]|nr:hypothetical protein [Bacteroidota bacterium]
MRKAFIIRRLGVAAVALTLMAIGLSACKKSNDITISGYTARDENGNLVGAADTSDWKTDAAIPDIVLNTFNTTPYTSVSGATESHFNSSITAYPNPAIGPFVIHIVNNYYTVYASQWLLVDQKLLVLKSFDFSVGSGYTIKTIDISGLSSGLYRLYYVFRDPHGTVVAQGYGDIQKQ